MAPPWRPVQMKADIIIYPPHSLDLGNKTLSLKIPQAFQ